MSGLVADVAVSAGGLAVRAELAAAPGELLAVVGPNGAGKTTLLRALAGVRPIDAGRIVLDGTVLDDSVRSVWVTPERRAVGMVFQDAVLFPHLSTLENVAFPLRARRRARAEARREAQEWLERVGLGDRGGDRPEHLSGGERQRVALARALAGAPRLLLLDEPFAGLDATQRPAVRREIRRQLADFAGAAVLVSHDAVDVLALADRVVVLEAGRVTHTGRPEEIVARPRTDYAAEFVGVNLVTGTVAGGVMTTDSGVMLTVAGAADGPGFLVVHPRAVALYRDRPAGTPRNIWLASVEEVDNRGATVRVRLAGAQPLVAEVTSGAAGDLGLEPGVPVWVAVKATEIVSHRA